MTQETFRDLVFTYARVYGQPYIESSNVAQMKQFLVRCLGEFCVETKCLYRDKVALTLSTSVDGRFPLRSTTYFEYPMFEIRRVVIDSQTLGGPYEKSGLWSMEQIELTEPNYRTATSGKPRYAATIPPATLLLVPEPDQVYSNCFVSGWSVHSDFDENDQTELQIAEEDSEAAALHAAYKLILPFANGPSLEKAVALRNLADSAKDEVSARAQRRLDPTSRREPYRPHTYDLA